MEELLDPGARRFSVQLRGAGSKPHLPAAGPGVTYLSVHVAHSSSELGLDHLCLTAASPRVNSELLIFPSPSSSLSSLPLLVSSEEGLSAS